MIFHFKDGAELIGIQLLEAVPDIQVKHIVHEVHLLPVQLPGLHLSQYLSPALSFYRCGVVGNELQHIEHVTVFIAHKLTQHIELVFLESAFL